MSMGVFGKVRCASLVVAISLVALLATPAMSVAAQAPVNLGTTSSFAILAGSTITNTGPTTINGDVGLHPGTAFTGQSGVTLNGALHLTDAVALTAKNDLVTAYNDAAGRTPVTRIPTELGGTTLIPGVYDSASGTFQITGPLTLDAQGDPDGVFIFLTDSTLITASNSSVRLINGARFCRIFWKAGSSATLGTNSDFAGHILALTSITARTGATVEGQLLARNGAVTLDTNTISNGPCAATAREIRVNKTASPSSVTSDSGSVTYTYTVSNPGTSTLTSVTVTDDKLGSVAYVSGDTNSDNQLQPGETWIYSATTTLTATTTNIATVRGSANGTTTIDTAAARVVVGPTGTVSGAVLPKTATPWYNVLLVGAALALIGLVGWRTRKIA
ncbi:MAG: hypothetical protein C0418_05400 [Coriobacteriaceae bacterium]|nr:hypothetical protein [Coriobacteriaceae bacterium]